MKHLKTVEGLFGDGYETGYLAPHFPNPPINKEYVKLPTISGKILDKKILNGKYYVLLQIDDEVETVEIQQSDFINHHINDIIVIHKMKKDT